MVRSGSVLVVFLVGMFAVLGGACAASEDDDKPAKSTKPTEETKKKTTTATTPDDDDNRDSEDKDSTSKPSCEDECPGGKIRCSSETSSAAEVCVEAADGCTRWKHGEECADGFTCDKAKDDGTCRAGCTNDPGCSAATEGDTRCSSSGTSEETCTKAGACFVFKTTRSNIPQECTSGNSCSGGQRRTCTASAAGACTQHRLVANACPAGTACEGAGQCVAQCTNACTLNANRCTGTRSRETCVKAATGCTVWTSTQSCSPDETCSNGSCS